MEVAKFIDRTLKDFWKPNIRKILRSVEYGYTAGEVIYKLKEGKVAFHAYKEFHPRDCRVLTQDHEYQGFRVRGMQGSNFVDLFPPKGFWFAVNREFGGWYGRSYLINIWDS